MKKIFVYLSIALVFFQCSENELLLTTETTTTTTTQAVATQTQSGSFLLPSLAKSLFVSTTGNDSGDGSLTKPWKTLKYAVTKVPANQGFTIQLSAGTFIENGLVEIPLGVSLLGAGIDQTILKAASSFYYNPTSPGYALNKFLISLNQSTQVNGNQTLKGFTIEGDSKKLHGGIYVRHRNNVTIDAIKVQNTNFTGIWMWDVNDSKLKNSQIINSSWGSVAYCAGALNLGNVNNVEIDRLTVDENRGYGIKAIGPSGNNNIQKLKIHDSRISVHPYGLWNGGTAPNIAIELWSVNLVGCEIYNSYVDNTISLINSNATPSTGIQTIRVHHNTIDLETRAKGAGYGVELTIHDAEIDHNYFLKGTNGIANWDHSMKNWNIHHNTFYALQGTYPGEAVRSQKNGLHNVKFYNNTIEFAGSKTMNVVGLYGGSSANVDIKNNLVINSNTGYNYYANQLIHLENGATLNTLTVKNNLFTGLPLAGMVAGTYASNLTADPQITKTGSRPDAYYMPKTGSPLINTGLNVGYVYVGSAPEIGALEYGTTTVTPVVVTPVVTPTVIPSLTGDALGLDSSVATLTGQVTKGYDPLCTNGNYFYVAPGNGRNSIVPPSGVATFTFQVPKAGNYTIWAKVKSPTASNQAFYIFNGNGKWFKWQAGVRTTWTWVKIAEGTNTAPFPFIQGTNQFKMGWADENVRVDKISITSNPNYIL